MFQAPGLRSKPRDYSQAPFKTSDIFLMNLGGRSVGGAVSDHAGYVRVRIVDGRECEVDASGRVENERASELNL